MMSSMIELRKGNITATQIRERLSIESPEDAGDMTWLYNQYNGNVDPDKWITDATKILMLSERKCYGYDGESLARQRLVELS